MVVFAMVQEKYDQQRSGQIISYIMAVVVPAPMLAPIIGGKILAALNWHWIFWALGGYALLTLFFARRGIPKQSLPDRSKRLNLPQLAAGYRQVCSDSITLAHMLAGSFAFAGLFTFIAGSPYVYITYFGLSPDHYGYLLGL